MMISTYPPFLPPPPQATAPPQKDLDWLCLVEVLLA